MHPLTAPARLRWPALLLALAALPGLAQAPDALTQARESADAAAAALLAPDTYARAVRELERATAPPGDPARRTSAEQLFVRAGTEARAAAARFAAVLKARDAAQGAEAYRLAAERWQAAERDFGALVRRTARGDEPAADAALAAATQAYADVELAALRNRYLAPARQQLADAEAARAPRYAPESLARAQALLTEADRVLAANRAAPDAAAPAVDAAAAAAAVAARVAREARRVADGELSTEGLMLGYEAAIAQVVTAAGLDAAPVTGNPDAAAALADQARALREDLAGARRELAERDRLVAGLEDEIRELDARLGGTTAERDRLIQRAEREARAREQVVAAAALFTDSEATVIDQGTRVTIRVTGLAFAPGGVTLDRRGKALLDKVAKAIGLFPAGTVGVEGHTDASGSDQANQRLSEQRAEAVAAALTTTLKLTPGRIQAVGYGEQRPVASNDSATGRARNRRIDVVITLPAG